MGFLLEIPSTGSTPYILVDEDRGYMKFEGESFHENVVEFYSRITGWLESYLNTPFQQFTFDCHLYYFNSSTAKLLMNMLTEMDEHSTAENQVTVNWITTEDNDIIIECGEDFQTEMEHLKFNLILHPSYG